MQQIENQSENKKTPKLERFFICTSKMVHLCLSLQNFSEKMRIETAYHSAQEIQGRPHADWQPAHRHRSVHRDLPRKELARDYENGMSLRQLATKYKIDKKTAAKYLRRYGVELRSPSSNVQLGPISQ